MGKNVNGKESVATMWARLMREAMAGEVVAIESKNGDSVVMISLENFQAMQKEIEELRKLEFE